MFSTVLVGGITLQLGPSSNIFPFVSFGRIPEALKDGSQPMSARANFNQLANAEVVEGDNINTIESAICNAMLSVPFTTTAARKPRTFREEPEGMAGARLRMAEAADSAERRSWAKVLYRRKCKWMEQVKQQNFKQSAMFQPRDDSFKTGGAPTLLDENN